jgi:DsbC/DsbD-like thiol-disulfide interchange protein
LIRAIHKVDLAAPWPALKEQTEIMLLMNRRELLVATLGLPALSVAVDAGTGPHYSARLIAGETIQGRWRAGLDIRLDEGWKTYWRMPGDAGVPPQFDWSRSRNVKSVTVLWPAPKRFTDKAGETVGYKDRVVFPLDVVAKDPAEPINLALDAFLGVCEVICIPVKLDLSLMQSAASPADESLIAAFAARVPHKADARSYFRVTQAWLVAAGSRTELALRLEGEGFEKDLDIFVEGGDFAYFRAPRPADDTGTVHLPIDGLRDTSRLRGRPLTLTMTAGDIRLEQDVVVD